MKRITVSDIKVLQQIQKQKDQILHIPETIFIKIINDEVVIYTESHQLKVYDIPKAKLIHEYNIVLSNIKNIVKIQSLYAVQCHEQNWLMVCDLQLKKHTKLEGHLKHITSICAYQSFIATSSRDMTIRLWAKEKNQNSISQTDWKPFKYPLVLKEHKGSVSILAIYDKFLMSGSQDSTIAVWANQVIWTTHKFNEKIAHMFPCLMSQKIIVISQEGIIHFIQLNTIIKKKIEVSGKLTLTTTPSSLIFSQINNSFFALYLFGKLYFVQANLMKFIHQIQIQQNQKEKLTDIKCRGRCLMYCKTGKGVSLIKL